MPAIEKSLAAEKLAEFVEKSNPSTLAAIYAEIYPEQSIPATLSATDIARHVRDELLAEEIVDLWNVIFPADRNVWYNEEDDRIRYDEGVIGYAEAD